MSTPAVEKKKISWWRTNFGEQEALMLTESLKVGRISQGPVAAEFETKMAEALKVPYIVATSSGSTAILMALLVAGIKPGDEVIVPNRTWIATAHAPALLGAKVRVVDVLADKPVMDVAKLEGMINEKTKAILPVSLNGRAVDMKQVWSTAEKHGIAVIEDAAQGLFSKYQGNYIGTDSLMGCFSLSIAKLLPAGQGGFIATRDKKIYESLKRIRIHGVDDVVECKYNQLGFNFRFTDLHACLAVVQLESIQERIRLIKEIHTKYEEGLKDLKCAKLIPVDWEGGQIPIYVEILCENRKELMEYLALEGIQTRPIYPNLESAEYLEIAGDFPHARNFAEKGLVLPCGPGQELENIEHVINVLNAYKS